MWQEHENSMTCIDIHGKTVATVMLATFGVIVIVNKVNKSGKVWFFLDEQYEDFICCLLAAMRFAEKEVRRIYGDNSLNHKSWEYYALEVQNVYANLPPEMQTEYRLWLNLESKRIS